MLSKLLSAKALAAVALGTASIGTAAAATGTLPDTAQAAAHRLVSALPDADRAGGSGAAGAAAGGSGAGAAAKAGADDHSAAGSLGLCQAYGSGQGGEKGSKLDSAAFQRLAEAAGGADGIAAYCAKVTAAAAARGSGTSSRASAPKDPDLTGTCRAWLAADRAGSVATLGKPVLDRLAAAAGGADSVAPYCTALAGQAPADQRAETTPSHPTGAPTDAPAGGSSPSHPAPPPAPRPTPRG